MLINHMLNKRCIMLSFSLYVKMCVWMCSPLWSRVVSLIPDVLLICGWWSDKKRVEMRDDVGSVWLIIKFGRHWLLSTTGMATKSKSCPSTTLWLMTLFSLPFLMLFFSFVPMDLTSSFQKKRGRVGLSQGDYLHIFCYIWLWWLLFFPHRLRNRLQYYELTSTSLLFWSKGFWGDCVGPKFH